MLLTLMVAAVVKLFRGIGTFGPELSVLSVVRFSSGGIRRYCQGGNEIRRLYGRIRYECSPLDENVYEGD